MNEGLFTPIPDLIAAHNELQPSQALGKKIRIHTKQNGFPDLDGIKIALFSISESRNDIDYLGDETDFDNIRKAFYELFPGNWYTEIADLGDMIPGDTVEDSYFALRETFTDLLNLSIIPVVIGGSQDLTYAMYRAYDEVIPMVNVVNVDSNFDLGDSTKPIKNNSFLGKIIMEKPYNLFNYAAVGYQTFYNSQDEIDLMEKLYFEAYRLGSITNDISLVEPIFRDANIVTLDLKCIQSSEFSESQKIYPNGFNGREICAIARYAGISNKVSSFGIFHYKPSRTEDMAASLIAQMIWYFIEGVNCRVKDDDFKVESNYQKYTVLVDEDELIFLKSVKTGRWWIEIPFLPNLNNKLKRHTLLPCMHQDYVDATNGIIPERWYKAFKKNSI